MERTPLLGSGRGEAPARRRGAWAAVATVAAAGAACILLSEGVKGGGRVGLRQAAASAAGDGMHKIHTQKMGTRDARTALDAFFDREGEAERRQHAASEAAAAHEASGQQQTQLNHENAKEWRFFFFRDRERQRRGNATQAAAAEEDKFPPSYDDLVTRRMNHKDKVKIGFYMESECGGCRAYSRRVLAKWMAVPEFNNMVELDVYPYGNAHLSGDEISCQHGPEECVGNKVIACMQKHRRISDTDTLGFLPALKCLMESDQPPELVFPHCSSEGNVDYEKVRECVYGGEGDQLALEAARATESLVPALEYSPWITLNGKPCRDAAWNLLPTVCEEYKGPKGRLCQAALEHEKQKKGAKKQEGAKKAGAKHKAPKAKKDLEATGAQLQQHGLAAEGEGFTVCERATGAEVPMPE